MAPSKKQNDFESRFFDLLEGTIDGMDKKIDRLDVRLGKLEKSVGKLENAVFPHDIKTPTELPPAWRDPNIIKLITLILITIILLATIFAALKGIELPRLF